MVLTLAALMTVRPDERVEFLLAPGRPLPPLCASRTLLGVDCPGCGLTRSFIYVVHGDLAASLAANGAGWLLFSALVLQVPYRLWALRHPAGAPLGSRIPSMTLLLLFAVLWVVWAAKMIGRMLH